MILVVSHADDGHTCAVLEQLRQLGASTFLFDLSTFPCRTSLSLSYNSEIGRMFTLRTEAGQTVDLDSCHAVWWRRPQHFQIDPGIINPSERAFTYNECHEAVSGLWEGLDAFWINDPRLDDAAAKKSFHLWAASQAGLITPLTLITNDVDEARAFVSSVGIGRTIYKSFSATETQWRETRVLQSGEEDLLDRVHLAPVIFQQFVPADIDLRVTIVGNRQFPAAISTRKGGYAYDYRIDLATARLEATTLPPDVGAALARLMRRLGLVFGAVDMRRTPDGQYVFLEINPAGLWLFVEEQTGQPVTRALAELLAQHDIPSSVPQPPAGSPGLGPRRGGAGNQ